LFLFELGYFKLTACARSAAAQAYFLSRLTQQTTLLEAVGGRVQPLELVRVLGRESPPLLDKALYLGARARVAARLIAAPSPGRGEETRLHPLARSSYPLGLEPFYYHCPGYGVDAGARL
jgi:hypothetical protein